MSLVQSVSKRLKGIYNDAKETSEVPLGTEYWATKPARDPRPDLEDPGKLWKTVLATCHAMKLWDVFELLYGLRIKECQLRLKDDGTLHLDFKPALDMWDKDELLDEWLKPNAREIKDVFARAEGVLRGLPGGARVPSWLGKGA